MTALALPQVAPDVVFSAQWRLDRARFEPPAAPPASAAPSSPRALRLWSRLPLPAAPPPVFSSALGSPPPLPGSALTSAGAAAGWGAGGGGAAGLAAAGAAVAGGGRANSPVKRASPVASCSPAA